MPVYRPVPLITGDSAAAALMGRRKSRFFAVLRGLEEVSEWGGDQVDHCREGCGVAVAAGSGAGGMKQAVEAFEAGVAVCRGPAPEDALEVIFEGGQRLPDGSEDGVVAEELAGVTQEVGDAPASGLDALGFADPAEHLLDAPGDGGQQA